MTPRLPVIAAAFLAATAAAVTATAQQYGQWWWDAGLGIGGRDAESSVGEQRLASYSERSFSLGLGLNGFVIHPLIGSFRLGLEGSLVDSGGGTNYRSKNLGLSAILSLFPRSAYPVVVSASRRKIDQQIRHLGTASASSLVPDTVTAMDLAFRIRKGLLRGLRAGASRSAVSFLDPGLRDEVESQQYAEWEKQGASLQQIYKVHREAHRYASPDLSTDTVTATAQQSATPWEDWTWQLFGVGIRQTSSYRGITSRPAISTSMQSQLAHPTEEGNLTLGYTLGLAKIGESPLSQTHQLTAALTRSFGEHFTTSATAGYGLAVSPGSTTHAPGVSLAGTWGTEWGSIGMSLSVGAGYSWLKSNDRGDSTALSTSASASLSHNPTGGWRKSIQVAWGTNEVQLSTRPVTEFPDLGLDAGPGVEDSLIGRATLGRGWRSGSVDFYFDSTRSTGTELADASPYTRTVANYGANGHLWSVSYSLGGGGVTVDAEQPQESSFRFASLGFPLFRRIRLSAQRREELRIVNFGPDVRSSRTDVTVHFSVGAFVIKLDGFTVRETFEGETPRSGKGLSWSVGRSFSGWLPFVSAVQPRGVIR